MPLEVVPEIVHLDPECGEAIRICGDVWLQIDWFKSELAREVGDGGTSQEDLALVGTPEAELIIYKPKPPKVTTTPMESSKSTSGTNIFEFKDKLHAGVTFVGVAFGVYYAYKTKASIPKYIGFALGAGAVGFILGSVASAYAMQTPVKQKKEEGNLPEGAKPAFEGTITPNLGHKGGKLDISIEDGTMDKQMNSIL